MLISTGNQRPPDRHIWATECIERTQNFSVVAAVLGDKLETVLRHYAHLRTHNAGQHADKFLAEILGNEDLREGQ